MPSRALIAATVDAFCRKRPSRYLGRTRLQKLCYFGREMGVPYGFTYRMYYYGPYSSELHDEILDMQMDGLLVDEQGSRGSNYKLTGNGRTFLRSHEREVAQSMPLVEKVAQHLGSLKPEWLELLATVKFTFERQKRIPAGNANIRSRVTAEALSLKGEKFKRNQVEKAYDILAKTGLLPA